MRRLGLAVMAAAACGPSALPPAATSTGAGEPVDIEYARPAPPVSPPEPAARTVPPRAGGETRLAPPPRYRGRPVDIDVVDADLHNVFRLLAEAGGANIVVADDVRGTVTLRLRQVPWDQALYTVARLKRLRVARDGDVFVIAGGR